MGGGCLALRGSGDTLKPGHLCAVRLWARGLFQGLVRPACDAPWPPSAVRAACEPGSGPGLCLAVLTCRTGSWGLRLSNPTKTEGRLRARRSGCTLVSLSRATTRAATQPGCADTVHLPLLETGRPARGECGPVRPSEARADRTSQGPEGRLRLGLAPHPSRGSPAAPSLQERPCGLPNLHGRG